MKWRRTDHGFPIDAHTPARPSDADHPLPHRQTLRGRAVDSNAADHYLFFKHRALVFNFVDVYNLVQDDLGRLKSCTLRCGICRKGEGWSWGPEAKGKGSTSNMIAHMRGKHSVIWDAALRADAAALGQTQAAPAHSNASNEGDLSSMTSGLVRHPCFVSYMCAVLTKCIT